MRRAAQRRAGYAVADIDIVYLDRGAAPPGGERCVVFEWINRGSGCRIEHDRHGLRYVVSPDKHAFWLAEARYVARRLQLERVYYRGCPTFGDKPQGSPVRAADESG